MGRSHIEVPDVWFRPVWDPSAGGSKIELSDSVADISSQPALWGSRFREGHNRFLTRSPFEIEGAMNDRHAADLIEAHLIETLSAVGRPSIDFYALSIRKPWQEATFTGAIEALESARQDGMVGVFGLYAAGTGQAALAMWQLHDAFDFVVGKVDSMPMLTPIANARRVGVVVEDGEDPNAVRLVTIRVSDRA